MFAAVPASRRVETLSLQEQANFSTVLMYIPHAHCKMLLEFSFLSEKCSRAVLTHKHKVVVNVVVISIIRKHKACCQTFTGLVYR